MPRRRTMTEYREIVRRLQKSHSVRGIQRETGLHRTIIRKIKNWLEKDYSFVVIHSLIQPLYECSEATVRRAHKQTLPCLKKPVLLRETIPGAIMEVDYGYLGITYDQITDKRRKAYVCSGRLNHSRDAYREIVFNQDQNIFFNCHISAYEYFRGVP